MIQTQGVPIIIGVSGHRDLPAFNESAEQPHLNVELEAKRALTYWLDKLIDTSIPVWLFTGCAQGADLVVVRAAEGLNEEDDYKVCIRNFPILAMPANYQKRYQKQSLCYFGRVCFYYFYLPFRSFL
jgi:hypothetical protein